MLTDKQLVEVVTKKSDSANALSHVHGFGPAKIERYGKALLAVVHVGVHAQCTVMCRSAAGAGLYLGLAKPHATPGP